jgi:two-component system, OmpR family, phosphate regulon response regulator PhoB
VGIREVVVLLVEGRGAGDDSLASALRKAGYTLEIAHTGAAAITWVETNQPDLIVFDARAMRSSGSRSCRRMRRLLVDTPLIHCRPAGAAEDETAEAHVYLESPFTPRKLLNRVRALLPADDAKEEIVRCGKITLYRSRRSICVGEEGEHRLTPKMAQLLEEFIRHPNELVSRRQLMQNVWKTDYIGDTRTLDVHIRWIREFIENDPANPVFLQTVRGKGYIFRMAAPDLYENGRG